MREIPDPASFNVDAWLGVSDGAKAGTLPIDGEGGVGGEEAGDEDGVAAGGVGEGVCGTGTGMGAAVGVGDMVGDAEGEGIGDWLRADPARRRADKKARQIVGESIGFFDLRAPVLSLSLF